MRTTHTILSLAVLSVAATGVHGQYDLRSWTVDTGGGESTGGGYVLRGTIAQHDAGETPSWGSMHGLTTGFWPAAPGDPGCNAADLAEPYDLLDLTDISAFLTAFVSMAPLADLDGSGIYDLADINAFVSAFTAGCP